jgi:hypothetical protein
MGNCPVGESTEFNHGITALARCGQGGAWIRNRLNACPDVVQEGWDVLGVGG